MIDAWNEWALSLSVADRTWTVIAGLMIVLSVALHAWADRH